MPAALLFKSAGLPMELALVLAPLVAGALRACVYGWFCVRLSGVYLAMLTLPSRRSSGRSSSSGMR